MDEVRPYALREYIAQLPAKIHARIDEGSYIFH